MSMENVTPKNTLQQIHALFFANKTNTQPQVFLETITKYRL